MSEKWQTISKRKLEQQASRIPKQWLLPTEFKKTAGVVNVLDIPRKCGILSNQELEITEARDATALVEKLSHGDLTSVDVVKAFCKVGIFSSISSRYIVANSTVESSNSPPSNELSYGNIL
jgi:amidase